MSRTLRIAAIPGDGIGLEVVPAGMRCVDAACAARRIVVEWGEFTWGSDHYRTTGRMMPPDALARLEEYEAIYLGAVGAPDIPDRETLWGLLIPIRRTFHQQVNLRPVRTLPGVPLRVRGDAAIDLMIVRENVEGEYSEIGGRIFHGRENEMAIQEAVFTRAGITAVVEYALALAERRRGHLTSATKSNGIVHTMPFWDEVVESVAAEHQDIVLEPVLIDALAAKLVLAPERFDVIVASNLFGDILSDLGSALTGSIGVAPSANLNLDGSHPSMFEPVHGSAPDIAGQGIANPVGQIWAGVLMLEHLGAAEAAAVLMDSMVATLEAGVMTRDLGGDCGTTDFADEVVARIRRADAELAAPRVSG